MTSANGTTIPSPDPKIIDLLNQPSPNGSPYLSLEYFPPRTDEGVKNLKSRMDRMLQNVKPLFSDTTWGAGGSTADLSLQLALYAHNHGHVSNMHLTCTNMEHPSGDPKMAVHEALQTAHHGGIRNIVALRGDPPAGEDEWKATEGGFTCALDLVQYIRETFGNDFGISVAGYPEGHPNAISEVREGEELTATEQARASKFEGKTYVCKDEDYKKEMDYLKKKIDAGADFIITQMFFDVGVFTAFVADCRAWGIHVPIVPGLMCINAYGGFRKMTKFCKTRVPDWLDTHMESIKDDAAAVKAYGIEFGAKVCRELAESGALVLHFYTLNLEKVVYGIMDELGLSGAGSLLEKANELDANSMVAKGSAWARVGDGVTSIYGSGVVTDIRTDGTHVVVMDKWELAGGQKPTLYLQKGQFAKA